ncbi:hypothetical protein [Streptomyces sp. RTGN2]|uniref:hypothetical protein n=1 Tax=unclassified Streptomyces TaxID=2593676 RepID=UPI002554037C|nr:hypothetical protein [Streptomyces sp. RTGN2]
MTSKQAFSLSFDVASFAVDFVVVASFDFVATSFVAVDDDDDVTVGVDVDVVPQATIPKRAAMEIRT